MIYNMDAMDFLARCSHYRTIFADIPDNIGLEYVGVEDKSPENVYLAWIEALIQRSMAKCDIFWLSYNSKWDVPVKSIVHWLQKWRFPTWNYKQILWTYTFGQYNDNEEGSAYRPILRFHKPGTELDYDSIRIPSERMRLRDPRAAGPRLPTDVWDEFPRVVGNAAERRAWHPTQHPEALMERVVKLSGGPLCDLFLGSGTTAIVCERNMIPWAGVELSSFYCEMIAKAINEIRAFKSMQNVSILTEI